MVADAERAVEMPEVAEPEAVVRVAAELQLAGAARTSSNSSPLGISVEIPSGRYLEAYVGQEPSCSPAKLCCLWVKDAESAARQNS